MSLEKNIVHVSYARGQVVLKFQIPFFLTFCKKVIFFSLLFIETTYLVFTNIDFFYYEFLKCEHGGREVVINTNVWEVIFLNLRIELKIVGI